MFTFTEKTTVVLVLLALALLVSPVSAKPAAPDNYCTTVAATPTLPSGTYTINATGAGRYARVVEYPVSTAPVVVAGPTDFGTNATVYSWTGVNLAQRNYQVQVSHTSLTTGFSTTGCTFLPPDPLSVILEFFDGKPAGKNAAHLVWLTTSELDTAGYNIYYGQELGGLQFREFIPSASPGSGQGAYYSYMAKAETGPAFFELWEVNLNGNIGFLASISLDIE